MDSYPFRFYGANPSDWYEGALCGHSFEAKFHAPLDQEARMKIASAIKTAAENFTCLDTQCEPCLFCGPWMLLTVGESDFGDADLFFEEVQDLWQDIHRAVPIDEVHFRGAREQTAPDDWSDWSVLQKPVVGPAPRWPGDEMDIDIFASGLKRFESDEIAEDRAFESARKPAGGFSGDYDEGEYEYDDDEESAYEGEFDDEGDYDDDFESDDDEFDADDDFESDDDEFDSDEDEFETDDEEFESDDDEFESDDDDDIAAENDDPDE